VKKSTDPLTWTAPGPTIDVSSLRGKSVALIVVSGSAFGKSVAAGMQQAADEVGIKFTPYYGDGTLGTARTQIANAVTSGVNGIVLESYDPTALRDSLTNAKANGVKIVAFGQYDYGAVPDAAKAAGVDALVGTCYKCAGVLMADALATDSGGTADALFTNVPEIGVANLIKNGFVTELSRVCPGCKVTSIDSSTGNMKTQLPQAVSSALVKDPNINYIVPVFDVYAAIFASSISSAGVADRVKLLGADASQAPLQEMQQGAQPSWIYNVGFNPREMGWTSLDQLMRVMLGQPTSSENVAPNRGFTPDTVKGLDAAKYPDAWFAPQADYYSAGYTKLWTH
jgi:ribose transport system substrate-binding protein